MNLEWAWLGGLAWGPSCSCSQWLQSAGWASPPSSCSLGTLLLGLCGLAGLPPSMVVAQCSRGECPRRTKWKLHRIVWPRSETTELCICKFQGSLDWRMPTCTEEGKLLTQSPDWNAGLLLRYPHRHTQNNVSPIIWTSLKPNQVDTKS